LQKWGLALVNDRGNSKQTVKNKLSALQGLFSRAIEAGLVTSNPCVKSMFAKARSTEIVRFLSPDKRARLMAALVAREEDQRNMRDRYNAHRRMRKYKPYTSVIRADTTGLTGIINQAGTKWLCQFTDAGGVNFPNARPTWAGLTPWDNGNFNPAAYAPAGNYVVNKAWNDTTGLNFNSGAPPSIASINSSGNSANVALTIGNGNNNSASAVVCFYRGGAYAGFFGLDTDNNLKWGGYSMGNVSYRIWHEGNLNPGSYAAAGAQVRWATGVNEFGSVVTGADLTIDAGSPWVMEGLRTIGGSNRIYGRAVWLTNQ
jgi:hypothetical protein